MIANEALLVPLAFFLSAVTDTWKYQNPGYGSILERWYFSNALAQGARQASNYRIAQAAVSLRTWITEGKAPEATKILLTADELMRLSKSDNRYRAIHSVIRWKGGRDIWTEDNLKSDDVEDHHIFPAALVKREGLSKRQLDSITNKLLVSMTTNRQLGDRYPLDYIGKLLRDAQKNGTYEVKMDMFRSFCLPVGTLEEVMQHFDQHRVSQFLELRAKLILEKLRTILGDSLETDKVISATEVDDEDDDD